MCRLLGVETKILVVELLVLFGLAFVVEVLASICFVKLVFVEERLVVALKH